MLRTFYATSFLSCVGILRHDSRDGAHENVNSYNVTTLEENNPGFTYQNRCATEWMIGVIAIYVNPKNLFFCIASNTEFFLSQYMGSFPVAIPDIPSRAEFVRSQLEILRICGNEIKEYKQSLTSVILMKTKKKRIKPGRCTAQSFRILVTLRDKVDSRSMKNKERKSRLTGPSSNYDSPRNHQGIVESRSIRTHTSVFSHLRRCGFGIGLPDNRRQCRRRRVTCSRVTYRSCTIRNEPTIPIKHLHNSGRREFRCYARTNMIFVLKRIGKEFEDYHQEVFGASELGTYVNATRHRSKGNTKRLICRSFYYSPGLTFTRGSTSQTTDRVSTALTVLFDGSLFDKLSCSKGAFLPLESEDKPIEGRISHPAVRKGMTYVRSVCKSGYSKQVGARSDTFWRKMYGVAKEEGTFLLKYVEKSHLYLYSDRFTPVLLIVSLAGIKVCSPDGKVSTTDAHTDTPAEKDTSRLCTDVVIEKPSCCPAASSKTQIHPWEFRAKSSPLFFRDCNFATWSKCRYHEKFSTKLDRIAEYPWQKICSYSTIIFSITICVQMAHALRRIFYATCEPQHAQFSFLAREPGAHFSLQYCHSFITESAEQEERASVLRPANTRGNIVSNVDTLTTTESQDLKASFCCLEDNIARGFEVPAAGTDIPKEVYEHSRYLPLGKDHERDRERQAERERLQLPLNVFNAAVEARKRSVGRSHRSASHKSRWGWNRVGRPERCSRFVFLVDFSLSLYVPGDIAIAGPVKHGGIHTLRLCELPPREKQQTTVPGPDNV
ncbi:hypothetical protein ALC57_17678 [Trachymyrmex cornetzi]|uniref:Uncharacterized protein n=1 Tax=Trachymyrmex cornetzi TaxID=471704 RepID=A0A151ITL3_9HYME|nr:hypothetical protein ALC57_17678 [Trachymyrmex cornetzi]